MKLSKFFNNRGFTMIELLVVIAVIGVLAVAVLSSINPIEQVNKGRDTRTRSDAAQLLNALDRYYAIQEVFPWNETDADAADQIPSSLFDCPDGVEGTDDMIGCADGDATDNWVKRLVDTAEVKQAYFDRITNDNDIYVVKQGGADGDTAATYACFVPRSRQFQLEAAKKCEDDVVPNLADADFGGGTDVLCQATRDGTQVDGQYICLP